MIFAAYNLKAASKDGERDRHLPRGPCDDDREGGTGVGGLARRQEGVDCGAAASVPGARGQDRAEEEEPRRLEGPSECRFLGSPRGRIVLLRKELRDDRRDRHVNPARSPQEYEHAAIERREAGANQRNGARN